MSQKSTKVTLYSTMFTHNLEFSPTPEVILFSLSTSCKMRGAGIKEATMATKARISKQKATATKINQRLDIKVLVLPYVNRCNPSKPYARST